MKLDDTLVLSAETLHNAEYHYGTTKEFWEKSAQIASIKGKPLTAYDMVLAHICVLETKISNKSNMISLYPEIAALYAVLASFVKEMPTPAETKLSEIESDVRAMAEKLAPMPRAEPVNIIG